MFQDELRYKINAANRELLRNNEAGQARALNRIAFKHLLKDDIQCEEDLFKVLAHITKYRSTIYTTTTLTVPNIYGRPTYTQIIDGLNVTMDEYMFAIHALCYEYKVLLSSLIFKYAS